MDSVLRTHNTYSACEGKHGRGWDKLPLGKAPEGPRCAVKPEKIRRISAIGEQTGGGRSWEAGEGGSWQGQ